MKCKPKSSDCNREYSLTEANFHREERCDFFDSRVDIRLSENPIALEETKW